MTQARFENLSAVVDGEESDNAFLEQISADDELASRWRNYHLIKDAMRNDLPDSIQLDIADAVAAAIDKEPTVIAPAVAKESAEREINTTGKDRKPLLGNVLPLFRQGGQFAIAASVAVAVIIGYQQINYSQQDTDLNIAPVKAVTGIQSGLSPVSLSHDTALPQTEVMEKRRKLNALMADHKQQMVLKTSIDSEADEGKLKEDAKAKANQKEQN